MYKKGFLEHCHNGSRMVNNGSRNESTEISYTLCIIEQITFYATYPWAWVWRLYVWATSSFSLKFLCFGCGSWSIFAKGLMGNM